MSVEMDEEIKRWTARRKSALVLDIIQGAYSSDREHVFHAMMNGARWKLMEFQFLRQVFTFGQGLVGFRFGF